MTRRNFICIDEEGYIRSFLHVKELESKECESTLFVAKNKSKIFNFTKWGFLQANNKDEDNIIENSRFIKPFFGIVSYKFFDLSILPKDMNMSLEEFCEKLGNCTIKEIGSKKYSKQDPEFEEITISDLSLPL